MATTAKAPEATGNTTPANQPIARINAGHVTLSLFRNERKAKDGDTFHTNSFTIQRWYKDEQGKRHYLAPQEKDYGDVLIALIKAATGDYRIIRKEEEEDA